MRTFLGVVIAVLVLAAAVLVSLSMIPPPAEEIPPDAVRVSSNGTVTVIFPWAISLATKWRAGPVDGLRISEDVASAAVLPIIRIWPVFAPSPSPPNIPGHICFRHGGL